MEATMDEPSKAHSIHSLPSSLQQQMEPEVIDEAGDMLLHIADPARDAFSAVYKVRSASLRAASRYFGALLDPRKFSEGHKVALANSGGIEGDAEAGADRGDGGDRADDGEDGDGHGPATPASPLPEVHIQDVGRIGHVKDVRALLTDFLRILHGHRTSPSPRPMPIANIANLVAVADRFDALDCLNRHRARHIAHWPVGLKLAQTEEQRRMKILIALLLGPPSWYHETEALVVSGSVCWATAPGQEAPPSAALWWDLPREVEDELRFRRLAVTRTVASLQSHFLSMYASRTPQCKLGYDNSIECDSFQLGEMVKFFARLGSLSLVSTMAGAEPLDAYPGNLEHAIEHLRKCPSYQIDSFHNRCGLRERLLLALSLIEKALKQVAICGACWNWDRTKVAWRGAKGPLMWSPLRLDGAAAAARNTLLGPWDGPDCMPSHLAARDMFLASERNWTRP